MTNEKNADAKATIVQKLTDIGYTVTYIEDSPFCIKAEYEGYSFLADVVWRDKAWKLLNIPAKKVKEYDAYDAGGKDKFLIFCTGTKRRSECVIHTDYITELGHLLGPFYVIELHWTSSIAYLRKLLEKMIV